MNHDIKNIKSKWEENGFPVDEGMIIAQEVSEEDTENRQKDSIVPGTNPGE